MGITITSVDISGDRKVLLQSFIVIPKMFHVDIQKEFQIKVVEKGTLWQTSWRPS